MDSPKKKYHADCGPLRGTLVKDLLVIGLERCIKCWDSSVVIVRNVVSVLDNHVGEMAKNNFYWDPEKTQKSVEDAEEQSVFMAPALK